MTIWISFQKFSIYVNQINDKAFKKNTAIEANN